VVEDIDAYFTKVREAGLAVQTDYIWTTQSGDRSFIFYDREGNQIQLWQTVPVSTESNVAPKPAVVF
jgi:predicted enzyme related to lactoylglutathione lyase